MGAIMESAITVKGQATIPRAVRKHLGLKPGDRVKFFMHPDGSVVLLPKLPASALRGFVSVVVMVETVWVLDRAYGLGSDEIAAAIERTLQIDALVVENEQEVFTAMIALKQGKGSFADAIILALGARAGCSYTLTFDQKASRLSGFRLA